MTQTTQQLARAPANLFEEFRAFLDKYGVIGLAIAIVIGTAVTKLVSAIVADIIMPIVTFFIPGGDWRAAEVAIGPVVLKWGDALGALVDFLIIALFVFLCVKYLLRSPDAAKVK